MELSEELVPTSVTNKAVKDMLALELERMLQLSRMYAFDSFAYVANAGRHPHQLMICLLFSILDSDCAILARHLHRLPV